MRYLFSIVVAFELNIEQMDVQVTFLYGDLNEKIYMTHPKHYVEEGKETLV
jgi:hypothetical protein